MDVCVLGSLNVDEVFRCARLPVPGETVLCQDVEIGPGGKGLNQAVAAARSGAATALIGAIGDDANGDDLLRFLAGESVDISAVKRVRGERSGLAHILVDAKGENAIVVAGGANRSAPAVISPGATVGLAQLETPVDTVYRFLALAKAAGTITIVNAAPAEPGISELLPLCDFLIVNEHELAQLSGDRVSPEYEHEVARAAVSLLGSETRAIIVTLGARGTQLVTAVNSVRVATRPVKAIDTTGAGDCFCGVFAGSIAAGLSTANAVGRANAAASVAVTRCGAAGAMPQRDEIHWRNV